MKLGSLVLVAVAATAACKKAPVAKPAPATPMPADVIAVITLPSFETNLPRLTTYLDKVSPEATAELRAGLEKDLHPDVADWKQPIYGIVVAPPPGADEPDFVAVLHARDEAALAKTLDRDETTRSANGWTVIGKPAAIDHVLAWATTSLVSTSAPTRITAVVYPAAIRARWADEIRKELEKGPPSPASTALRDLVLGLLEQTERVEGFADVEGDDAVMEVTITPRAGSTFAIVLAAQTPSTFALLEQLPFPSINGTMAGHVELGPLSKPLHDLLAGLLASELAEAPPGIAPALGSLLDTFFAVNTGEYAGIGSIGSNSVVNTFGVSDTARVSSTLDALVRAVLAIPLPPGIRAVIEPIDTYDGVTITSAKLLAGEIAAMTATWAAWDGRFALVITDPDGLVMRSTIQASRGKSSVPRDVARVLDEARKRGDSLVDTIDMMEGEQPPFAMGLGVRSGALRIWGRFPAAQIKVIGSQIDD